MSNYIQYEIDNNEFLRAIQKGGSLFDALTRRKPFDALLVPIQTALELEAITDTSGTLLSEAFLDAHVIHLEHRYGQAFTTLAGTKGQFGDQLEALQLQGQPTVTVLRHAMPIDEEKLSPEQIANNDPRGINFFLIGSVLLQQVGTASSDAKAGNTTKASAGGSGMNFLGFSLPYRNQKGNKSTLGMSDIPDDVADTVGPAAPDDDAESSIPVGVVIAPGTSSPSPQQGGTGLGAPEEDSTGSATKGSAGATPSPSSSPAKWTNWLFGFGRAARQQASNLVIGSEKVHEQQQTKKESKFREFQKKMGMPASQPLVKEIVSFIADQEARHGKQQQALLGDAAAPPASPFVCPEELHGFIDDVVAMMETIDLWSGDGEEGLEAARDGVEKYLLTKLFPLCFCRTEAEVQENAELEHRLSAFRRIVKPEQLDAEDMSGTTDYHRAMELLRKVNSYKNAQDKIDCVAKCLERLLAALKTKRHGPPSSTTQLGTKGGSSATVDGSSLLVGAGAEEPPLETAGRAPSEGDGADHLIPCFLLLVLEANVPSLLANARFIERYRHPKHMTGEAGYCTTTLLSVALFWLKCTAPDLRQTQDEYDACLRGAKTARSPNPASISPETGGRSNTSTPELCLLPSPDLVGGSDGGQMRAPAATAGGEGMPKLKPKPDERSFFDDIFPSTAVSVTPPPPVAVVASSVAATTGPTSERGGGEGNELRRGILVEALHNFESTLEGRARLAGVASAQDLRLSDVEILWSEYLRLRRLEEAVKGALDGHSGSGSDDAPCP